MQTLIDNGYILISDNINYQTYKKDNITVINRADRIIINKYKNNVLIKTKIISKYDNNVKVQLLKEI